MNLQRGFTIIELMVTVSLAALLLTMAVPSFINMSEQNKLSTQINSLTSTLQFARSESVKRGQRVTVCMSDDGTDCGATGYENGWIVFVDNVTGNGALDVGEVLLKVQDEIDGPFTLRGNNRFVNFISYLPTGGLANTDPNADQDHFVLCKNNDTTKARAIFIVTSGRVRLAKDTNYDHIPEDDSGNNITSCTPP